MMSRMPREGEGGEEEEKVGQWMRTFIRIANGKKEGGTDGE